MNSYSRMKINYECFAAFRLCILLLLFALCCACFRYKRIHTVPFIFINKTTNEVEKITILSYADPDSNVILLSYADPDSNVIFDDKKINEGKSNVRLDESLLSNSYNIYIEIHLIDGTILSGGCSGQTTLKPIRFTVILKDNNIVFSKVEFETWYIKIR